MLLHRNHFSPGIGNYIRPKLVDLFRLIIQRSNLDGGTPKSWWGDARTVPRGSIPGPCPPKWLLVPPNENCTPKRGLCAEEINRLGATGVQIEAQISVCHRYFRNSCGLTTDFMTFLEWRPFSFFFGDHLFLAGKTFEFRKIPPNFWSSPSLFDPDWDKFLVPPCPSRIHINKLLVPPKIYFCPPVTLSWPEMETGWVDRPVGLPVGSRFFDRPVKSVEIPVKLSFLATKII